MGKRVSEEDWGRAQALFAIGKTYREISESLEGRASASAICTKARKDGWLRGVLPDSLISEDTPQIYESASSTPEERDANTTAITAATRRKFAERKVEIADNLADGVMRLYGQMFAPHVLKEAKVLSGGQHLPATVEIVEIPMSEPSPADKKHLATALAILVDKASLLVGDATSRVETASMTPDQQRERLEHIRSEFEKRRQAELDKERGRPAEGATG
jgi:hypothetical protein